MSDAVRENVFDGCDKMEDLMLLYKKVLVYGVVIGGIQYEDLVKSQRFDAVIMDDA